MAHAERARQKEQRIAPVNLSEYPTLVRLWQECGSETPGTRSTVVWDALRRADAVHAYRSGSRQIIGYVISTAGRLEVLCVAPAYQGQGVGTELLRFAMERQGAREVDAEGLPPGAWAFFSAHGLRPLAPRPAAMPLAAGNAALASSAALKVPH